MFKPLSLRQLSPTRPASRTPWQIACPFRKFYPGRIRVVQLNGCAVGSRGMRRSSENPITSAVAGRRLPVRGRKALLLWQECLQANCSETGYPHGRPYALPSSWQTPTRSRPTAWLAIALGSEAEGKASAAGGNIMKRKSTKQRGKVRKAGKTSDSELRTAPSSLLPVSGPAA